MFRILTAAAILALTTTAGLAGESLTSRIHTAAVAACAPESNHGLPIVYYDSITARCVARISAAAMMKYQTAAEMKTRASTAAVDQ